MRDGDDGTNNQGQGHGIVTQERGSYEFPPPRGAAWDLRASGVVLGETHDLGTSPTPLPACRRQLVLVLLLGWRVKLHPALLRGTQHLPNPATWCFGSRSFFVPLAVLWTCLNASLLVTAVRDPSPT